MLHHFFWNVLLEHRIFSENFQFRNLWPSLWIFDSDRHGYHDTTLFASTQLVVINDRWEIMKKIISYHVMVEKSLISLLKLLLRSAHNGIFVVTLLYFPNFSAVLNAKEFRLISKWRKLFALELNRAGILDFEFHIAWDSSVWQCKTYFCQILKDKLQ